MLLRLAIVVGTSLCAAVPVSAGTVADLSRVLRIDDVVGVMRDEGLAYGDDLEGELFPGAGGTRWAGLVDGIYDPVSMRQRFDAVFVPEMTADPAALEASVAFFASDRGQRIVALEIAAREALLDDTVEEAAQSRVDEMRRTGDPRLTLITRYAEVNDLIEQNVAGALNSNLAFYHGMALGGAFPGGMTEREIVSEVWSQETDVRDETKDWLFPFLALAYEPLSDDDLRAYVAFSASPSGQTLNAALFAGFDAVFATISQDLGQAAAQMISGKDL